MSESVSFQKIKVGVLMGGKSIEREVSFNSGRTICDHLDSTIYDIIPIFQTEFGNLYILPWSFLHRGKISDFFDRLNKEAKRIDWDELKTFVDFIYITLHGRFGEDGTVQGFLEVLDIPYLGAKVFGSSLGMNKIIQKKVLRTSGIDVAKDVVISAHQVEIISSKSICEKLKTSGIDFDCIVKPVHEGSSIGVSVVGKPEELLNAIKYAAYCDPVRRQDVLIEEKIEGMEFVSVCLQKNKFDTRCKDDWFALSITQVITEEGTEFYDYDQKYMPGRATKFTPARCSKKDFENIINTCIKVSKLLNFTTISRIDGFLTKDGKVVIIDPNALTGMSPSSFLFNQAAQAGMSHTQLINYLIESELQRYGFKNLNVNKKNKKISMQNKSKIRVAVLLGGDTNEREISLESGRNICYKLSPHKYEVIPIFVSGKKELFKLNQKLLVQNSTREISEMVTPDLKLKWSDLPKICDFVFIGLHGGIGENGCVQGMLQMLGLPYNGPGVFTSSLCMDKFRTCEFLRNEGFDVPRSVLLTLEPFETQTKFAPQGEREEREKEESKKSALNENSAFEDNVCSLNRDEKNKHTVRPEELRSSVSKGSFIKTLLKNFTFPLVIKPHDDGCSVFLQKVNNEKELFEKLDLYFKNSGKSQILIEEFIQATELTCGVIGNDEITVLPPSQVFVSKDILSIEEKFLPGAGQNLTPAPLPKKALDLIQDVLGRAYKSLGCKGYSRIDCFYQPADLSPTKKDRVIILEVNTLPGMTPATCLFHQAAEIGLKPMEFVDKIVELGMQEHKIILLSKEEVKQVCNTGKE
jgi:D-alanine-D-alanine ligase